MNEQLRIQLQIDKISQRVIKQRDLAFRHDKSQFGKSETEGDYKDYNTQIDAPMVAAFVTFEYSESMARCIEDYTRFQTFPRSLFYPPVSIHFHRYHYIYLYRTNNTNNTTAMYIRN